MTHDKIDCSFAVNYLREKTRMTKGCEIPCCQCPLSGRAYEIKCYQIEKNTPEKAVEIVQEWSNKNPYIPKSKGTYKEDFFKNYPKAKLVNGYPIITSACSLYPEIKDLFKGNCANGCHDCWYMKKE